MFSKTVKYKLLAFGRKYKLGIIYELYAKTALAYLEKKKKKLLDDLSFEGGILEYTTGAYLLAYGRLEFYMLIFANIIGALVARFFPFFVTDFVYDSCLFFYENPLVTLVGIPIAGAVFVFFIPSHLKNIIKFYAFFVSIASFFVSVFILGLFDLSGEEFQFQYQLGLIETVNIFNFSFGVDGLSILLVVLTNFLFSLCFFFHLTETKTELVKEQSIIFFLLQFTILVAFIATDILFFYLFFEASLIPLFLFIGIWGTRERKIYAAYKMFFYTLLSSLPMLVGLLILVFATESSDIQYLKEVQFDFSLQKFLWFLFFFSFATKLPMLPVHLWLPEAHVEATTTGSVILAGILLKLGGYGFFRFLAVLFPDATSFYFPFLALLSVFAIIYASLLALRQIDIKKIIAYSSIAHMGFVSLGFACLDVPGIQGSFFILLSHGFISAGLFFCVGMLYARYKTKVVYYFSSLASFMPIFSFFFFCFILGNIGLPTTSGFIGELLVIFSVINVSPTVALLALTSVILSVSYSLTLFNRVCFGVTSTKYIAFYQDLNNVECLLLLLALVPVFFFGLFPQGIFEYFDFFAHLLEIDLFCFATQ